ncbi:PilZ domain-containing protein [Alteromonas sediminis]|uniref:PilZ domain-containing protein n=1 Tax=Alteromonas sediminis TaxID=2259342 RepID=A0A3N5XYS0_9ALTE|nr:PilZ domain-containing protein [Alteromonas sediminis]RPJ65593.1 PilZ domain-containing protein [Alteromonas sediminis]
MSQDLQQYAPIIEQLKPMVREPEFNQVVDQIAADVPKEKRFLIKMEVRRLAKPCIRSIDLRSQVEGDCELYEYDGIKHFLDETAIELFEQQIRIFGEYTFGVYEAILSHTRDAIEQTRKDAAKDAAAADEDPASNKRYSAPIVNLLEYAQRHHERMNFAVAIEVFTEHNKSVLATSIDISTHGMKMRTGSDMEFKKSEKVSVYFRGLESEFALDKRDAVTYFVVASERDKKEQVVRLKRATDYPNPPFDQFLEKFIHGNKRRYKVNMNNTIDAIINKSCEQYLTPRLPSLPVFIDQVDNDFTPRYAMTTLANRDIIDYWTDEEENIKLGFMLSQDRLKQLCTKANENEMIVFCFNHIQNDRIYFYSATPEELENAPKLKNIFLGFGARKISWRVFKLKSTQVSPEDAHTPLSIPDSISVKIKRQSAPPAPRLMARLKNIRHLVYITDITDETGQQCYASHKVARESIRHLRIFGHPRNRIPADIKVFRYKYSESRIETRYLLRSPVELSINDVVVAGITEDISVQGLKIELASPFHGAVDNRVTLNFKKLQAMTTKHDVSALQYRVVNITSEYSVLHLRSINGDDGKPARKFFEELIKQNRARLKTYPEEEEFPGIGQAMRFMHAKNTAFMSFVAHKKKGRFYPYACVMPEQQSRLKTLASFMAESNRANLEFLYRDRTAEQAFIELGFKQTRAENRNISGELFMMFDPLQKNPKMSIITRWSHRFNNHGVRQSFIDEALKRGQFIAVKVILANTDKPDMELLQLEMNYISMYALHRAKELEEQLWATAGCVFVHDITDEVLMRYQYSASVVAKNQQTPAAHKIEVDGIKALLGSGQE